MNAFIPATLTLAAMAVASSAAAGPTLAYLGRSSVKIVTAKGFVVYIDPYAPGDYSAAADLVLVTHGHGDHNKVKLVTLKKGAVLAAPEGAASGAGFRAVKEGDAFELGGSLANGGIKVRCVAAYNKNHKRIETVGYVLSFDGIAVYHAGDTNYVPEMKDLAPLGIDYALLPTDGYWNMGGEEAAKCADACGAKHAIAIHSSPDGQYDEANAAKLKRAGTIRMKPGETIALTKR